MASPNSKTELQIIHQIANNIIPIDLLTSGLVRTDLLTCTTFYERKNSPRNHVYNLISNIFIH